MRNLKTLALLVSVFFLNNFYAVNWTWVGGSSTDWDTKANWSTTSGATRPQTGDDVFINAGAPNQPTLFNNRTIRNLTMNGGTLDLRTNNLTLNGTATLNGGNITNSQTGSSGQLRANGNVTLNSSTDFSIIAPSATVLFRVYGNMNFTDGVFWTSSDDLLRFENNATASNASSDSYVEGPTYKLGNDAFTFPVGKNGLYAPITMTAPATNTTFSAEYFPTPYVNTTTFGAGVDHVSVSEYWMFTRIAGTGSVNVTLSYHIGRSGPVNSQFDLLVVRWNGSQWASHGNGAISGSPSNGTVRSSAAITAFSPFTIGSSTALNPLPVNIISFNAEIVNSIVKINWMTSFEKNNDFYTIEKSLDGINWTVLSKVKGNINSESVSEYLTHDNNPVKGVQYYRLSQTDLDGKTVTFETVAVNHSIQTITSVSVYPNPSAGILNINLSDIEFENASLTITNLNGQVIIENNQLDASVNSIDIAHLTNGIYFLNVVVDGQVSVQKITKN